MLNSKDSLDHAWRYFALHAGQRMSMFNYFLILFGLVSAGVAGCIRANGLLLLVGAGLGIVLLAVAYVFWKLDQRTAFLVKHAEGVLCNLEKEYVSKMEGLFQAEPDHTRDAQIAANIWTYGASFRFVFSVAGVVGFVVTALCVALYFGWLDSTS